MNHACRWCGLHDCAEIDQHDRLFRSSDLYPRMTARLRACPACGGDVTTTVCTARPTVASLGRAA